MWLPDLVWWFLSVVVARLYFWYKRDSDRAAHSVSKFTISDWNGLRVTICPSLSDNLCYIISNVQTPDQVLVIDAVEPDFSRFLAPESRVVAQLATHWHPDHCRSLFPGGVALSSLDAPRASSVSSEVILRDAQVVRLAGLEVVPLLTPCHTRGHMCFLVSAGGAPGVLLTGDTVFAGGGAGKFFEGHAHEMFASLQKLKRVVPDGALMLPGHEYARVNARWAVLDEQRVAVIEECLRDRRAYLCSWGEEKSYNPFLCASSASALMQLRSDKDTYKADKFL